MAIFRSERDLVAVAPAPTVEEAAALAAALAILLNGEQDGGAPAAGRWALAGRLEAQGSPADRRALRAGWRR